MEFGENLENNTYTIIFILILGIYNISFSFTICYVFYHIGRDILETLSLAVSIDGKLKFLIFQRKIIKI